MKIAVIIDTWFPFVGGGQNNALEISKQLAKRGIDVEIITRNNGKETYSKGLKVTKLGTQTSAENNFSKLLFLIRSFFYIYNKDFDLVHAHAFFPGVTARMLMVFKGIPAVFTVHGTSMGAKLNGYISRSVEEFILTKILYTAQITVSRDFLKIKNVNKNILYIPNGVNIRDFDKVIVNKFKNPTLIFVGRLHSQKNLKRLISAIELVKSRMPNINLLVVGKGELKDEMAQFIKSKNLQKSIKLLGEKSGGDLIILYKSSHIFILTSFYEGQPLSLLEAWAAKLPVIVPKTGDCPYMIKNNKNGYLIDNQQDPIEIAKIITLAFKNGNLEKMGMAGYNSVKEKYSWEDSAQKTFNLYEKVVRA